MHEIMTIEEVADYLRVSERTVYEWAQKGDLPGGKLGTTWRFKREDVENWVNSRLSAPKSTTPLAESTVLTKDRILLLDVATKEEVLTRLVDLLAQSPLVKNRDALLEGILEREALMSTGIGFGVGVPHVRLDSVKDLVMAVAVCKTPISDYASLDKAPVQIVCMLAAHSSQHKKYIRMLASISSRLRESAVREEMVNSDRPDQIYHLLMGEG